MYSIADIIQKIFNNKDDLVNYSSKFSNIFANLKKAIDEGGGDDKKKSRFVDWAPSEHIYTPEQHNAIKQHLNNGYHPREAEHMVGIGKPKNYEDAVKSNIKPTEISDKYLGDTQHLAKEWINNYDAYRKKHADPSKNVDMAIEGAHKQASESHLGDYKTEKKKFLDNIKDLHWKEHKSKLGEWEKNWKESHPDHDSNVKNFFDESHKKTNDALLSRQLNLKNMWGHIIGGGFNPDQDSMSESAARRDFVGGVSDESGEKQSGSIEKDPMTSMVSNPKVLEHAKEQYEKLKHVKEAASEEVPDEPEYSEPSAEIKSGGAQTAKAKAEADAKAKEVEAVYENELRDNHPDRHKRLEQTKLQHIAQGVVRRRKGE